MTKWSDPLQILITCCMEAWLRRLRLLGFLVCMRPVSVSSLFLNPHLDSWQHFQGGLLKLSSLSQPNWTRAIPKCAPRPHFALLLGDIQDFLIFGALDQKRKNERLPCIVCIAYILSKLVEPEWVQQCESRHNRSSLPCLAESPRFLFLRKRTAQMICTLRWYGPLLAGNYPLLPRLACPGTLRRCIQMSKPNWKKHWCQQSILVRIKSTYPHDQ